MSPEPRRSWLRDAPLPQWVARLVVGGVYVWFGVNKIADPIAFLKAMHAYGMLPESPPWLLNGSAVVLPWFEILCGLLLVCGIWRRHAAVLLLLLTAFFTVVVAWRAHRIAEAGGLPLCGVKFDCGCGVGEVWFCHKVAENTALVLLAALAAWSRAGRRA